MESIENPPGLHIRPLSEADLPGALVLSQSAHWNQNEADWRDMLALGQGWGIDAPSPPGQTVLAASTVVLPYGPDFAWVSMVLVLPEYRRQGLASLLLRHALAGLQAQGRSAVLDATPAGHAVYQQEGFADTWGFARYRREALQPGPLRPAVRPRTRPLLEGDWPAIAAWDVPAFGADRVPLLRRLAARRPDAALVLEEGGRIAGYVLARDGREATQIGPLLARDEACARELLGAALAAAPGPVYVDALDGRPGLLAHLRALGFVLQRPFTRMVHGRKKAPGNPDALMLVAGPELG
jgi:ribosomal protein S18 acetylase RimI-like enzyme